MLSRERELRGGVIELFAGAIILPAICIVAVIAGTAKLDFLEGPPVGIVVAALATGVRQAFELSSLLTGLGSVALLAGLRLMQSREREVRVVMFESGSRLKGILRVAAEAIRAELALMLIFMTGKALTAKTQEGSVQILQFDLGARANCDLGCDMTVLAFLLPVLAGQGKACLRKVVEVLTIQTNQRRCLPAMFLMTAPAIRFAGRALVCARVKPGFGLHPPPDLGMTLQTLEAARGRSKFVAGPALRQPF